jgi:hypothetical protein
MRYLWTSGYAADGNLTPSRQRSRVNGIEEVVGSIPSGSTTKSFILLHF